MMKSRSWIVCSAAIVALVALVVTLVAAVGGGAQVARGPCGEKVQVPCGDPARVPHGGQELQQAWLLGADTAWAWTQSETGPLSGGGAQGIELTVDGGMSWSDVTPPGLPVQGGKHWISGFFALNANDAWVTYGGVGSDAKQTIIATTNGGRTWRVLSPEPPRCELDFVSIRKGWCPAIGAAAGSATVTLYRTTNGGHSWRVVSHTPIYKNAPGALPYGGNKEIDFRSAAVGWAVFEAPIGTAQLFETDDAGRTWVARHVASAPHSRDGGMFAGEPVLDGRYGAVGYNIDRRAGSRTIVYVTTDRGRDWHPVIPPGPAEQWLVDTLTARRWRLFDGNQILVTNNMGRSWQVILSTHRFPALFYAYNSPTGPVAPFASDGVGWVVQADPVSANTLWRTLDGGRQWHRVTIPGS